MPADETSALSGPLGAAQSLSKSEPVHSHCTLIVEDNAADAVLTQQMLVDGRGASYEVVTASRISEAKDALSKRSFDIVLLDLSLPDARDLEGLAALLANKPSQAIVVLTGQDDEALGLRAIHNGAQDYLVKNRLTADLLTRSLRYAMERSALQLRLEVASLQQLREREITALQSISRDDSTGTTKRRFKSHSLSEAAPKIFSEFVSDYEAVFATAITEQVHKMPSSAAGDLTALAEKFCRYRVGPKDVLDVHLTVLERKVAVEGLMPRQIVSLTNEARVVLLQVLGLVAEGYRAYAMSLDGEAEGRSGTPEDR